MHKHRPPITGGRYMKCSKMITILENTKTRLEIYRKIKRSEIHRVATRPFVFPCADVIIWLILNVDFQNRLIETKYLSKVIASFQPSLLDIYYKFTQVEIFYNQSSKRSFTGGVGIECYVVTSPC